MHIVYACLNVYERVTGRRELVWNDSAHPLNINVVNVIVEPFNGEGLVVVPVGTSHNLAPNLFYVPMATVPVLPSGKV